jgi:hypothetical protein
MVESGWTASEVTQEHLQNLVSQGLMTAAELATCRVPKDPASPVPAGGYVVVCVAFFEWGFGVPSHQFLQSLLQLYGVELHYLTPSGILYLMNFLTLCEAYMGIEPHFNLWNCQLSLYVIVSHLDISLFPMISQEMVSHFNVFHSFVKDWVFGYRDGTDVFTHEGNSLEDHSKVSHGVHNS